MEANFNLGLIFLNADGVERDIERGLKHMISAAEGGHDEAKLALHNLKENYGFDVPTFVTMQ